MAPAQEIDVEYLPPELQEIGGADSRRGQNGKDDWETALQRWAQRRVMNAQEPVLGEAVPKFERTMITVALAHTNGRRQDAARLLGWGRNTLTRKIKELGLEV